MHESSNPPTGRHNLRCRFNHGVLEIPVHFMRGGTSTGVVIWEPLVPSDEQLRAELLRHLMGVPQSGQAPGNRQVSGLGRGPGTSNKVFLARVEATSSGHRVVSTLAQLASSHGDIDWSVNCGNMSSSLPLWAIDSGMLNTPVGVQEIGQAFADIEISIENPAGKLDATVTAKRSHGQIDISAAAYRRSAQVLMRGVVPLYGASAGLVKALLNALED